MAFVDSHQLRNCMHFGCIATKAMKETESPRKVIVYRKELLRLTDTFVRAQVLSYHRCQVVLFGERTWPGGAFFGRHRQPNVIGWPIDLRQRIFAKARQTAGIAPASVMRKFEMERASLIHAHFGHDGILALPYASKLNVRWWSPGTGMM
jgi:hypothetical protein